MVSWFIYSNWISYIPGSLLSGIIWCYASTFGIYSRRDSALMAEGTATEVGKETFYCFTSIWKYFSIQRSAVYISPISVVRLMDLSSKYPTVHVFPISVTLYMYLLSV